MADGKKLFPGLRPVLIAAVAGLAAGAVAVYVTGGPSGNNAPAVPVTTSSVAEADIAACGARSGAATALAAAATGEVAAMLPADPPQSLKGLAFNDPSGRPTTLGAIGGGKVLLVNLWATWCAPCRAEMPALDALQGEMGGDAFEVVAINVDTGDDAKPKKFLAETKIQNLAYYRDSTLGVFNEVKKRGLALGLPVTLLVDRDGCLLANMNGPAEWAGADARKLIEAALK
ncbi:MAG: TlpA disulfide reductase family protein [Mesorhizobium sp.]|nr:TlpA disulfide reductase family protein [Mesorhizobium sp.]